MKDIGTPQVRTLGPDELITEPGFYEISLDRHHSQPCDGISVTSSTLRDMLLHGPEYVWAFSRLNEKRYERKETDALRLGRAMAAYVENGPEGLEEAAFVLPKDKPNKPTAAQIRRYNEGSPSEAGLKSINFWRKVDADPRMQLSEDEWEMLCAMGKVVGQDPIARACLEGIPEITMAWFDEDTGLWVLSRPDVTSFSGMLSDYKKVSTQGAPMNWWLVDRKIQNYRYDIQMGLANEAFERLTGQWCETAGLIFQMDKPPFSVIARGLSDQDLRIGAFECQRQRREFRKCFNEKNWPGPGVDVGDFVRPEWAVANYAEEMGL
jgi:hypothetical protein